MELDEAMAVSHPKPISEVLCFFCNRKGHYKSDCPERKAWEKSKKTSTAAGAWESSDDEAFWLQGWHFYLVDGATLAGVYWNIEHIAI